jgi:hypothetical protein
MAGSWPAPPPAPAPSTRASRRWRAAAWSKPGPSTRASSAACGTGCSPTCACPPTAQSPSRPRPPTTCRPSTSAARPPAGGPGRRRAPAPIDDPWPPLGSLSADEAEGWVRLGLADPRPAHADRPLADSVAERPRKTRWPAAPASAAPPAGMRSHEFLITAPPGRYLWLRIRSPAPAARRRPCSRCGPPSRARRCSTTCPPTGVPTRKAPTPPSAPWPSSKAG